MENRATKKRKRRSDKKVDCKPTIPLLEKDRLYEVAWWALMPVKDAAEKITLHVLRDKEALEVLRKHFVRGVHISGTYYNGHNDNPRMNPHQLGDNARITIKYMQNDYDYISALAYALGSSKAAVVAWAIAYALPREEIIRWYIETHSAQPTATRAGAIELWFRKNF